MYVCIHCRCEFWFCAPEASLDQVRKLSQSELDFKWMLTSCKLQELKLEALCGSNKVAASPVLLLRNGTAGAVGVPQPRRLQVDGLACISTLVHLTSQ